MAELPLDPPFAKVLIQSQVHISTFLNSCSFSPAKLHLMRILASCLQHQNCTSEVIAIISLLSVDQIFFTPQGKRDQAIESRKKFAHRDGDHLMLLNVLKAWQDVKGDQEWARENFVNVRNMKHVLVRSQSLRSR